MENENKDAVVTNTDENTELDLNLDGTEDVDVLKQKLADAEEAKRQITARAHKAEAENKVLKSRPAEAPQTTNSNSLTEESVDVKILESQGIDEEAIKYLRKIAKINGTSVLAAQSDDVYKTWKSNKDAEAKEQKARVGASRGSGSMKAERSMSTPGLSDEDHKALWLKSQGR